MTNVVKKYSISYELAQKMVDAAVAKARELGVSENVAILDDGGNLRPLAGWMAPRSLPLRWPRTRHTQLCSASPRRSFSLYPERPVAFGRHPHACAYGGVGWRVFH